MYVGRKYSVCVCVKAERDLMVREEMEGGLARGGGREGRRGEAAL